MIDRQAIGMETDIGWEVLVLVTCVGYADEEKGRHSLLAVQRWSGAKFRQIVNFNDKIVIEASRIPSRAGLKISSILFEFEGKPGQFLSRHHDPNKFGNLS